jgi:4a-hydroxytetrahydrobiopterin dehydratase
MGLNDLAGKFCVPCQGGASPLSYKERKALLKELGNGWTLNYRGHVYKKYSFKEFKDALAFAIKVGEVAEREGHHPDLKISGGECSVEIWTHKINGLTESDFILTAKIEEIH